MFPILKRFRLRITRGWALLMLFASALTAAAFWIGPLRPLPAELRLLVVQEDGRLVERVTLDEANAMPSTTPGAAVRFPLVVAVRNVGARPAQVTALYLSVPSQYRVLDGAGLPLPESRVTGNPLVRYRLELQPVTVEPGAPPLPLGTPSLLWLEPVHQDYQCRFVTPGVPEFVPAPQYEPEIVAEVEVFYSFEVTGTTRQTGLLGVRVDPALLRREPVPMPPSYPIRYEEQAAAPELSELSLLGARDATCGDADEAEQLHTVTWLSGTGARVFVIHHGGIPRKNVYDLNGDGFAELEIWDPQGTGRFQASRQAHYRVPSFLLPLAQISAQPADTLVAEPADTLVAEPADTLVAEPADTLVAELADTLVVQPADTLVADPAATGTLRADTLPVDTLRDERVES